MKILLIQESSVVQRTILSHLSKIFSDDILEVFVAFNGREGFRMMTTDAFDLIITDTESQDSHSFLVKISNNKILSKKKIVIFSSESMPLELASMPNIKHADKSLGMHAFMEIIKALTK